MRTTSAGKAARSLAFCALLLCTACLGPNHATGRLMRWNSDFESKWSRQGVFMLSLPAYLIFGIGDNLVFNSVFWWTGNNPVNPPGDDSGPTDVGF